MSMRYAFVLFPHYCHQYSKTKHPQPLLVLVKESRNTLLVSELGDDEYNLGIRIGMPLAQARAIVPHLAYRLHDEHVFTTSFAKLARAALRFSPHVAPADFGILINITGCAHLFGDETMMLTAMTDFYRGHGFTTAIAIAPYPLLAKALAHHAPGTIVDDNHQAKSTAKSLPIAALFADDDVNNALHSLAITTIGELTRIPRAKLAARFGLGFIQQLDQLFGEMTEPPHYQTERPRFVYRDNFSSPIRSHEQLMHACAQSMKRMLDDIIAHHYAVARFTINFVDIFKKATILTIQTAKPHNVIDAWMVLLKLKTENLRIHHGIDAVIMQVVDATKAHAQQQHFNKERDHVITTELAHLADQLQTRLGREAIFNLRINDAHLPEHAVVKNYRVGTKTKPHERSLPPRPVRLLKNPLPVTVLSLLPDNPPKKIMWRQRSIIVCNANGPERIEGAWWAAPERPRNYYVIEDDKGKRWWIFSTGEPKEWFIHGMFC